MVTRSEGLLGKTFLKLATNGKTLVHGRNFTAEG